RSPPLLHTLSLHDALPISVSPQTVPSPPGMQHPCLAAPDKTGHAGRPAIVRIRSRLSATSQFFGPWRPGSSEYAADRPAYNARRSSTNRPATTRASSTLLHYVSGRPPREPARRSGQEKTRSWGFSSFGNLGPSLPRPVISGPVTRSPLLASL